MMRLFSGWCRGAQGEGVKVSPRRGHCRSVWRGLCDCIAALLRGEDDRFLLARLALGHAVVVLVERMERRMRQPRFIKMQVFYITVQ